ncbi:hypothetical protein RFI_36460 [Reticulomyxa filosa]|uniref:Uncharacterized protein n=1 Tax=Reticulomyxa filosa TaxID=46433 RepID=X6LI08_RETFI|nr:hypothetical protein RFI_36460 [Reticulomyxa filosa]|eukprot:ETO00981.1 hypothetical protein RFI_36460 [Reticulomyxa filosa]
MTKMKKPILFNKCLYPIWSVILKITSNYEISVNINLNKITQVQSCFQSFNAPYKQMYQKLFCCFVDLVKQATEHIQMSKFEEYIMLHLLLREEESVNYNIFFSYTNVCDLEQSNQYLELDFDHLDSLEKGYKVITYLSKLRRWIKLSLKCPLYADLCIHNWNLKFTKHFRLSKRCKIRYRVC